VKICITSKYINVGIPPGALWGGACTVSRAGRGLVGRGRG